MEFSSFFSFKSKFLCFIRKRINKVKLDYSFVDADLKDNLKRNRFLCFIRERINKVTLDHSFVNAD